MSALPSQSARLSLAVPCGEQRSEAVQEGSLRRRAASAATASRQTHQELLLSVRAQRADRQLQGGHRQGVGQDGDAEAFVESHQALRLQRFATVERAGPAGVQGSQVDLHIPSGKHSKKEEQVMLHASGSHRSKQG